MCVCVCVCVGERACERKCVWGEGMREKVCVRERAWER